MNQRPQVTECRHGERTEHHDWILQQGPNRRVTGKGTNDKGGRNDQQEEAPKGPPRGRTRLVRHIFSPTTHPTLRRKVVLCQDVQSHIIPWFASQNFPCGGSVAS